MELRCRGCVNISILDYLGKKLVTNHEGQNGLGKLSRCDFRCGAAFVAYITNAQCRRHRIFYSIKEKLISSL